jgi:hypothetical protein
MIGTFRIHFAIPLDLAVVRNPLQASILLCSICNGQWMSSLAPDTAYPDSVSLVNPPKTTIPKTLAALPSSQ